MAAAPASPLEAAESQLESGQYGEAGASLGQYYESLSPELKASQTGEFIVMRAADAYDQAYEADGAREHLEASQALLQGFVATVGSNDALAARPAERLAKIREMLETTEDDGAPAAGIVAAGADESLTEDSDETAEDDASDATENDSTDDSTNDDAHSDPVGPGLVPEDDAANGPRDDGGSRAVGADAPPGKRDRLGLGLTIGGAAGIVVGASMIGWGVAYESAAKDNIDERGGSSSGDDAYLQDAKTVRNGLLIPGVALATLGTGALILGAVRLARARRNRATAWQIAPSVSPRFAGFTLRGSLPSRAHR